MKLLLKEHETRLRKNGSEEEEGDHKPVVKIFTPDAGCTWLISEILPDGDTCFALCDLGMGYPELGYVPLSELRTIRGGLGLPVERDLSFKGEYPLTVYADAARIAGRIVLNVEDYIPTECRPRLFVPATEEAS